MLKAEIKRKTKGGGIAAIIKKLPETAQKGVLNAAESTRQIAVKLAPGPVRDSIKAEIIVQKEPKAKSIRQMGQIVLAARVFNDTKMVPWGSYAEFGTGLYVEDEGVKEAIRLKRAKSIPWYIHVSMVPESFARYNYPLVVGANGEKYWEVDGMKPHPYMYPAARKNREKSAEILANAINEMIRSVT